MASRTATRSSHLWVLVCIRPVWHQGTKCGCKQGVRPSRVPRVRWVSTDTIALGTSFDQYVQRTAQRSGVSKVIGSQALLKDHTSPAELEELQKLANEQLAIACCFDTKFSNTVFTFLQKTQQAFMGTGDSKEVHRLHGYGWIKFYQGHHGIWNRALFLGGLGGDIWRGTEGIQWLSCTSRLGGEGVPRQATTADCTVFMDESFQSLHGFSDTFNVWPFIPVIVVMAITHHLLLTSLRVNVSYIPMQIYLSPLMSDATAALGQMVLQRYVAQQSIAIQEKQSQSKPVPGVNRGKPNSTLESEDELMIPDKARHDILHEKPDLTPSKKDW